MEGLWRLNPFYWSLRAIKVFLAGFFLIMVPVFFYIGFQPASTTEALSYETLTINSIKLEAPVAPLQLEDHQLTAPAKIAGAYSQNPHRELIIGHSSTVFRNLEQVTIGTEIIYGEKTYIVTQVETLPKSEISMQSILATSETDTIVIMTCAGDPLPGQDATHRLIITAVES